jgi:hypothetical protein
VLHSTFSPDGNFWTGQVNSRPPSANNALVGSTTGDVQNVQSGMFTGIQGVNQSDTAFYPMISAFNQLTGIGYTNIPSFGYMRPTGDYGQSGQAVIQLTGDGTPLVRWRFKANGNFESQREVISNLQSGTGLVKSTTGAYLGYAGDYEQCVILLHEIGNPVATLRNSVNGQIQGYRGDANAGLMAQIYNVNTASANGTFGNLNTISVFTVTDQTLFTCMYGGKKYLCIRNTDVPAKNLVFKGDYQNGSGGACLQFIVYNNTSTGVINAEINGSLVPYTNNGPVNIQGGLSVNGKIQANAGTNANEVVIKSQLDAKASSGVYTPLLSGAINVNSLIGNASQWSRVDNVVTVTVQFSFNEISANIDSAFYFSLPVYAPGGGFGNIVGGGFSQSFNGTVKPLLVKFDQVDNTALCIFKTDGAPNSCIGYVTFQYNITE